MKLSRTILSHSFLLVGAVNALLGIIALINKLGIRYYFFKLPFNIEIVFLSPLEDLYLFIGSLYLLTGLVMFLRSDVSLPWVDWPIYIALFGSLLSVLANVPQFLTMASQLGPLLGLVGEVLMSLGGLLALCASILHAEELLGMSIAKTASLFLTFLFCLLIPIELWALPFWLGSLINPFLFVPYSGISLELQIFNVAYPLAPWLFVAFLFSWVWAPLLKYVISRTGFLKGALFSRLLKDKGLSRQPASRGSPHTEGGSAEFRLPRLGSRLLLAFSLLVGSFLAYSPYLDRPESWLLGDDADYYYDVLTQMAGEGVYPAFTTNKPLYFLLIHLVRTMTLQSPLTVVRFLSVLSFLVFSLSVFWLVKTGTDNEFLASLSSLFSIFSFTTIIGMNTGLYANWSALSLSFLFFTLLLKALRGKSKIHALLACLVSTSTLFIHYSAWAISMIVLLLYTVFTFLKKGVRVNYRNVVLGLILFLNATLSLACLSFEPYISERLVTTSGNMFSNLFQTDILHEFWFHLRLLMDHSTLSNPLMFFLSVVGMASITGKQDRFSLLTFLWMAISSVGSIMIAPYMWTERIYSSQLWRFIFNIPFHIPAAIGLHSIFRSVEGALGESSWTDEDSSLPHLFKKPHVTLLFLLMNYAVVAWLLLSGGNVGFVLFLLNGCAVLIILLLSRLTRKGFSFVFRTLTTTLVFLFFLNYAFRYVTVL